MHLLYVCMYTLQPAGNSGRREPTERQASTDGESEVFRDESEGESPGDSHSEIPSRLRAGVWSVVGRAIDSLIGGGNGGGGDGAQNRVGSAEERRSDAPEQESPAVELEHGRPRPPTDAELQARMGTGMGVTRAGSPSSKSAGPKHTPAYQPAATPETEAPSTMGQVALKAGVKVPISLTPMQPPPDVLAAMKDRAASGHGRPRFTAPPDDVAAALEKTRGVKNYDHGGVGGPVSARGEEGHSGTRYT